MKSGTLKYTNLKVDGTAHSQMASGLTTNRPPNPDPGANFVAQPQDGMIRYNPDRPLTDTIFGRLELYYQGDWFPLITIADMNNDQDVSDDPNENVTLSILSDLLVNFFANAIGNIDLDMVGYWPPIFASDPAIRADVTDVGLPSYVSGLSSNSTGILYPITPSAWTVATLPNSNGAGTNNTFSRSGAEAYVVIGDGQVDEIQLISPGSNYTFEPTILLEGGGGENAFARAIYDANSNTLTGIKVTSRGSGYTSPPTVRILGDGAGASGTAVLGDGKIVEVRIIRGGSGYTSAVATVNSSSGSGAQLTPVIEGGAVRRIDIVNKGSGYQDASVTITPNKSNYTVLKGSSYKGFSEYGVFLNISFVFDIFDAIGVPVSERSNYRVALFTSLNKVSDIVRDAPSQYFGSRLQFSITMQPRWNKNFPGGEFLDPEYGRYTGFISLYGTASYHSAGLSVAWYASLNRFRNF